VIVLEFAVAMMRVVVDIVMLVVGGEFDTGGC